MSNRWIKILALILATLLPIVVYFIAWSVFKQNVLNRIGYSLWIYGSTEDHLNLVRMMWVGTVFNVLLPLLIGITGVFWGRHFLKRKAA